MESQFCLPGLSVKDAHASQFSNRERSAAQKAGERSVWFEFSSHQRNKKLDTNERVKRTTESRKKIHVEFEFSIFLLTLIVNGFS